jgi:hypothetical protein
MAKPSNTPFLRLPLALTKDTIDFHRMHGRAIEAEK